MMSSNLFFLRSFRHRAKTTVQIMLNLILLLMALDVVCSAPNLIPNQSDYDEISMNSYSDYEYDLQDLSTALQKNPVGSELSIVPEKYVSCTLEINDESNTDGHIFRRQAECSTKNDQKGKNPCIKNDRHPNHVTCPRTRFNSNWEELVNCVPGKVNFIPARYPWTEAKEVSEWCCETFVNTRYLFRATTCALLL